MTFSASSKVRSREIKMVECSSHHDPPIYTPEEESRVYVNGKIKYYICFNCERKMGW